MESKFRIKNYSLEKTVYTIKQLTPMDKNQIVFAGRSNVGKSSLINNLLGNKKIAKVSSKPGKTQSINYFLIDNLFYLVDLPGFGYARAPREAIRQWGNLITRYFTDNDEITGIVQIIDIRHEPTPKDMELREFLKYFELQSLIVASKSDKLSNNQQKKSIAQMRKKLNLRDKEAIIPFSAKTGFGKENILNWIFETVRDKNSYKVVQTEEAKE